MADIELENHPRLAAGLPDAAALSRARPGNAAQGDVRKHGDPGADGAHGGDHARHADKVAPRSACFNATPCAPRLHDRRDVPDDDLVPADGEGHGQADDRDRRYGLEVVMASAGRAAGSKICRSQDRRSPPGKGAGGDPRGGNLLRRRGCCSIRADSPGPRQFLRRARAQSHRSRPVRRSVPMSPRSPIVRATMRTASAGSTSISPFWLYEQQKRGRAGLRARLSFEIGGRFGIPPAAALPVWARA